MTGIWSREPVLCLPPGQCHHRGIVCYNEIMEPVKVVIRYANGNIVKGFTMDFFPNKPLFHVHPVEVGRADKGIEVMVTQLKAIFFVKDFTGDASHRDQKVFAAGQQISGRKVEVTFHDGEVMVGSTIGYDPKRPGFFFTPADSQANNLRVYVVSAAVKSVRFLQ